jgi:hypothetical protein
VGENVVVNSRAFACLDCKELIDSGYRWCYWQLEEPGVITLGECVNIAHVLRCEPYWNFSAEGPSPGGWLERLMPKVRAFLLRHGDHRVIFGEAIDDAFDGFENASP